MQFNVGGLARVKKLEIAGATSDYMSGSGLGISTGGFAVRLSETNVLAATITNFSLGEIIETTTSQPDGTGAIIKPSFINIGIGYAKNFSERISAGITTRVIYHSIANVNAAGVTVDAGIQYQTGSKNQFKMGVALKNIGPKMDYQGDGFTYRGSILSTGQESSFANGLSIGQLTQAFEHSALLNLGVSYDIWFDANMRLTPAVNFVSNSFTKDQVLTGMEFAFRDMFFVRGGFDFRDDVFSDVRTDLHTGPSFGVGLQVPYAKVFGGGVEGASTDTGEGSGMTDAKGKSTGGFGIDYSYRATNPYNGTHTIGLTLTF